MEVELTLVWAIIVTITLGIIVMSLIKLRKTHDHDIQFKESEIQELVEKLKIKQTRAFQGGVNMTSGDYTQILGDFVFLTKYDQIITLSTTASQASLDLIGISEESIDFLEIKKKGGTISKNENHIRRLIEEKKVSYKVFDIELPKSFDIKERKLKEIKKKETPEEKIQKINAQKEEAQKKYFSAYEPWTKSNDEFLKSYWNDKMNNKSNEEKINELSIQLGRNKGGIQARLKKFGLN
jgi:hypothetical protein